jgi:hypothetical protein
MMTSLDDVRRGFYFIPAGFVEPAILGGSTAFCSAGILPAIFAFLLKQLLPAASFSAPSRDSSLAIRHSLPPLDTPSYLINDPL